MAITSIKNKNLSLILNTSEPMTYGVSLDNVTEGGTITSPTLDPGNSETIDPSKFTSGGLEIIDPGTLTPIDPSLFILIFNDNISFHALTNLDTVIKQIGKNNNKLIVGWDRSKYYGVTVAQGKLAGSRILDVKHIIKNVDGTDENFLELHRINNLLNSVKTEYVQITQNKKIADALSNVTIGGTSGAAGFAEPEAYIGTNNPDLPPTVSVTASGPDTAKKFTFYFNNIKGGGSGTYSEATASTLGLVKIGYNSGNNKVVSDKIQCPVKLINGQMYIEFTKSELQQLLPEDVTPQETTYTPVFLITE